MEGEVGKLCTCSSFSAQFAEHRRRQPDTAATAFATNCPNLTTIDLYSCANITDTGAIAFANNCPNLTTIDIDESSITDTGATAIANSCPNLLSIDSRPAANYRT